jgi:hypothetical protein
MDGDNDEDMTHRIKARWIKWCQAFGILCDKRVPQKLKGKFDETTIRPAMLYGAECWPTKRWHVQRLGVVNMHMLRWMCGHTRKDRVRNDDIRDRQSSIVSIMFRDTDSGSHVVLLVILPVVECWSSEGESKTMPFSRPTKFCQQGKFRTWESCCFLDVTGGGHDVAMLLSLGQTLFIYSCVVSVIYLHTSLVWSLFDVCYSLGVVVILYLNFAFCKHMIRLGLL